MTTPNDSFVKFSEEHTNQTVDDEPQPKKAKIGDFRRKSTGCSYKDCQDGLDRSMYVTITAQKRMRHSLLPDFNVSQCSPQDFAELKQNIFPHCSFDAPKPIYIAQRHSARIDRCFQRTLAREMYRVHITQSRTRYQNAWKKNKKLRALQKKNFHHTSLFTFAERLERPPDPYFYGNYDYYYTGGNLCVLPDEQPQIFHVDERNFSQLKNSYLMSTENAANTILQELSTCQMPDSTEIFEVCPLMNVWNENREMIAVRQNKSVTLLTVDAENSEMTPLTQFKTKSTPFISLARSIDKPEMFVITSMKQHIRLYDISKETIVIDKLYKMENADLTIGWNSIKPWTKETFLYANERQICLTDFRTPQADWLKSSCTFSSKEYQCEFISSLAVSKFNNLFYVGTNHKLKCLDVRFMGERSKYFETLSLCEWTHLLKYPPVYIDTFRCKRNEFVALSSQIAGDIRICELNRSKKLVPAESDDATTEPFYKYNYKSLSLPWQPSTLQEAYENACLAGKCLQPEADLKQRIRSCTTGLTFCPLTAACGVAEKHIKALLLFANSNGDVYAQTMRKRKETETEQRTNEASNESMANYATKLCELTQPDLNYTDVVQLNAMSKVFLCPTLSGFAEKTEATENEEETRKAIRAERRIKGRWAKPMSTLCTYKDALAQDLLAIWDIPYDEEKDVKLSTLNKKFKAEKDRANIVNSWLADNTENNAVKPMTSIPVTNLNASSFMETDILTQDFQAQPQSTQLPINTNDLSQIDDSFIKEDNDLLNISMTKAKDKKKKKKYVKGF